MAPALTVFAPMGMDASLDPHLLPFVPIITLLGCMLFPEAWVHHCCHRPRL